MADNDIINWQSSQSLYEYIFKQLVISFAVVLIILVIFNSHRSRSSRIKWLQFISNKLLKIKFSSKIRRNLLRLMVWIAFTLSDFMATYAIGINTEDVGVLTEGLYMTWTIFLYYISWCHRSFLPSFKDIESYIEKHIDLDSLLNLRSIYQGYLIFTGLEPSDESNFISLSDSFVQALLLLWCSSGFKVLGRLVCVFMAERGDTLVSDHMANDHGENYNIDTDSMQGYRYPVITGAGFKAYFLINTEKAITVTVDKIWRCQGQLLSCGNQKSAQLKDICLSFALFNLLRRRFDRFPLVEASLRKTKDFVLRGLLSRENDLERAFRVVEVELGFLYDFFYKKNDITFYFAFLLTLMGSTGVLVGSSWLFWETNKHQLSIPQFLALSIAVLEIWQLNNHVCSDWTKVILIKKYVEKPSWHNSCMAEKLIGFICKTRPIFRPSHLMLGQYSVLLQSFNSIYTYALRYGVFVNPMPGDMIKLRDEVKVAILRSLKASDGKLSNGQSSLSRNRFGWKLSWVYTLKTISEIMWVWHIATSMCEIASDPSLKFHSCLKSKSLSSGSDAYNLVVAVSLSRYCAYLAVFAPELLPDEQVVPWDIFRDLRLESSEKLRDCKSMNEKLDKMKKMGVSEGSSENNTLLMTGIKLGKQLLEEIEDESERWRILADLWAELMLYLAPSDEIEAHADHLADGGELITYLWVLLIHAGVLKRP